MAIKDQGESSSHACVMVRACRAGFLAHRVDSRYPRLVSIERVI